MVPGPPVRPVPVQLRRGAQVLDPQLEGRVRRAGALLLSLRSQPEKKKRNPIFFLFVNSKKAYFSSTLTNLSIPPITIKMNTPFSIVLI